MPGSPSGRLADADHLRRRDRRPPTARPPEPLPHRQPDLRRAPARALPPLLPDRPGGDGPDDRQRLRRAAGPGRPPTVVLAVAAFIGTVALWWCYFHRAERIGATAAEEAPRRGRHSRPRQLHPDPDGDRDHRDHRRRRAGDRDPPHRQLLRHLPAHLRRPGDLPPGSGRLHAKGDRQRAALSAVGLLRPTGARSGHRSSGSIGRGDRG